MNLKNKFLEGIIKKLQGDYVSILNAALANENHEDFVFIVDEINLFWFKNRDIVGLILKHISYNYECFTFTGATFLDVDDYEHYPFVVFGKIHIVDDPLYKFMTIYKRVTERDFSEKLKRQIISTIKDNIKIIQSYSNSIYILPVTLLTDLNEDLHKEVCDQIFFSMFKDSNIKFEDYRQKFSNISDIELALANGVAESIVFSEDEKHGSLSIRFKSFIDETPFAKTEINEAMQFFFVVYGFISQSLSILLRCSEYKMVPYLRSEIIFRYTMLIGMNFRDSAEMGKMIFRSICAHILYRSFDKSHFYCIEFERYLNEIEIINFDKLFDFFESRNENLFGVPFETIRNQINDELSKLEKFTLQTLNDQ